MAEDQTVVEHLLQGRRAMDAEVTNHEADVANHQAEITRLLGEVERLHVAMEQLDAVIGMVGSGATSVPARSSAAGRAGRSGTTAPGSFGGRPPGRQAAVREATGKAATRQRKPRGEAPKSIRVHVLEMLAAEDRDWNLAEIIDRIRDAGIQAHDDAVRSITIKLMKDGRVERIGRGQYRLARRGSRAAATGSPAADAPAVPSTANEPIASLEPEPVTTASESPASTPDNTHSDADVHDDEQPVVADAEAMESAEAELPGSDGADEDASAAAPEQTRSYTPPLNLGQPWG